MKIQLRFSSHFPIRRSRKTTNTYPHTQTAYIPRHSKAHQHTTHPVSRTSTSQSPHVSKHLSSNLNSQQGFDVTLSCKFKLTYSKSTPPSSPPHLPIPTQVTRTYDATGTSLHRTHLPTTTLGQIHEPMPSLATRPTELLGGATYICMPTYQSRTRWTVYRSGLIRISWFYLVMKYSGLEVVMRVVEG